MKIVWKKMKIIMGSAREELTSKIKSIVVENNNIFFTFSELNMEKNELKKIFKNKVYGNIGRSLTKIRRNKYLFPIISKIGYRIEKYLIENQETANFLAAVNKTENTEEKNTALKEILLGLKEQNVEYCLFYGDTNQFSDQNEYLEFVKPIITDIVADIPYIETIIVSGEGRLDEGYFFDLDYPGFLFQGGWVQRVEILIGYNKLLRGQTSNLMMNYAWLSHYFDSYVEHFIFEKDFKINLNTFAKKGTDIAYFGPLVNNYFYDEIKKVKIILHPKLGQVVENKEKEMGKTIYLISRALFLNNSSKVRAIYLFYLYMVFTDHYKINEKICQDKKKVCMDAQLFYEENFFKIILYLRAKFYLQLGQVNIEDIFLQGFGNDFITCYKMIPNREKDDE